MARKEERKISKHNAKNNKLEYYLFNKAYKSKKSIKALKIKTNKKTTKKQENKTDRTTKKTNIQSF